MGYKIISYPAPAHFSILLLNRSPLCNSSHTDLESVPWLYHISSHFITVIIIIITIIVIIITINVQHLLYTRHYSKYFIYIYIYTNSLNPNNDLRKQVLVPSLFYQWGTESTDRLINLPKPTQLVSDEVWIWTQALRSQSLYFLQIGSILLETQINI